MSAKNDIQLSILIPSIPSRWRSFIAVYNHIVNQIGDRNIEVLGFTDNKKRSIGEKRDALIKMSNGKYFMFVDDDDELIDLEDIYNATFFDVDVITFKQLCKNADGSTFIVDFGLGNEIEHNQDKDGNYLDCKRPPFHVCAWHNQYKKFDFPAVNYSEDWGWLKQFVNDALLEIHIDKVLVKYNFDPKVTEASTEDNSEWKNPNKSSNEAQSNS